MPLLPAGGWANRPASPSPAGPPLARHSCSVHTTSIPHGHGTPRVPQHPGWHRAPRSCVQPGLAVATLQALPRAGTPLPGTRPCLGALPQPSACQPAPGPPSRAELRCAPTHSPCSGVTAPCRGPSSPHPELPADHPGWGSSALSSSLPSRSPPQKQLLSPGHPPHPAALGQTFLPGHRDCRGAGQPCQGARAMPCFAAPALLPVPGFAAPPVPGRCCCLCQLCRAPAPTSLLQQAPATNKGLTHQPGTLQWGRKPRTSPSSALPTHSPAGAFLQPDTTGFVPRHPKELGLVLLQPRGRESPRDPDAAGEHPCSPRLYRVWRSGCRHAALASGAGTGLFIRTWCCRLRSCIYSPVLKRRNLDP